MLDYIIIGSGLAGIAFCETAQKHKKTFKVLSDSSQNSSKIAAGLYNPVILKRFSQVWHAKEQLDLLDAFYKNLEIKLNVKLDYKLPILRKLFSIEEQNNWFLACDKFQLEEFLSFKLNNKKYEFLPASFGFGEVFKTGYIDTSVLLDQYQKYLTSIDSYANETFDYNLLKCNEDYVTYNKINARHIVFCEGFGIHLNPFFNHLQVDGTKGELLLIRAVDLNVSEIINSSIYLIPLGNNIYKVGATYNWEDKTNIPTEIGRSELILNLKNLISCKFEILDHRAGIRPTVKDRRPLVGTHPFYKRYHVLNGLGTRGVMLAPEMALHLFNHVENKIPLNDHIDIKRYDKFRSSN